MTDEKRTEPEQVKPAEVEQVKQQADVKQALKQTSTVKPPEEKPKAETKDKLVLSTHAIVLIGLAVLYDVLGLSFFGFAAKHPDLIKLFQGLDLAALAIVLTLDRLVVDLHPTVPPFATVEILRVFNSVYTDRRNAAN